MNILITGSSQGIGLYTARHLQACGHRVLGLSRKEAKGEIFEQISCDITSEQSLKTAFIQMKKINFIPNVLINNAGIGMTGSFEFSKKEDLEKLFALNLFAAVRVSQLVLPFMRENNGGKILHISSIGSEMGLPFRGFYSASKAALDRSVEALRYELLPWEIQTACLHLGDIQTNIADSRLGQEINTPYQNTYESLHHKMNVHVQQGCSPQEVAYYIEGLLNKNKWRAHFYFGKMEQKIAPFLKSLLPQTIFENLMRWYNGLF